MVTVKTYKLLSVKHVLFFISMVKYGIYLYVFNKKTFCELNTNLK